MLGEVLALEESWCSYCRGRGHGVEKCVVKVSIKEKSDCHKLTKRIRNNVDVLGKRKVRDNRATLRQIIFSA